MNKLFYERLVKYTSLPYELIIIDNNSTDGSREFYENKPHTKVYNTNANYNYPYCQNKGIELASFDIMCFFNNDILLTPNWDSRLIDLLKSNKKLQVLSISSIDRIETRAAQKKLYRRWKHIKYPLQFIFGHSLFALKLMTWVMYGSLNKYAEHRYKTWKKSTIESFAGSAVVITRKGLEKIGLWDERIQAADFDLFYRTKAYALEHNDLMPMQVALGIYFHHYVRLTAKVKYPPFANKEKMMTLEEKWTNLENKLKKDLIK